MAVKKILDTSGVERNINVGGDRTVKKSLTKEKLRHLSKTYRTKLIVTHEDHDNYIVVDKLINNLIKKGLDNGLVGYKAKAIYESIEGKEKDKLIKILQLTSR